MINKIFRSVSLKLLKILGLYNCYAKFRFNSKLNELEGKIHKVVRDKTAHNNDTSFEWNSLLFVVPSFFSDRWDYAAGNFYFELFQSAREKHPEKNFWVHLVKEGDLDWTWNLLEEVRELNPNVILISPEIDPNGTNDWTISKFVIDLKKIWQGKLVFLMFDSVYPLHMWRVERLAMLAPNCKIIAIDRRFNRKFRKNWNVEGPVFLPISKKSLAILKQKVNEKILVEALPPIRVSFVGKVYPYREKYLKAIARKNWGFEVNPHYRMKDPESYLSYITAIKLSRYSINLSQAGGSRLRQLKCRVLECMLFDSTLVTDDRNNNSLLGIGSENFVFIRNFKKLNLNRFDERKISPPDSFKVASKLNSFFDID
jgi:hypothetical protein